MENPKEDQLSEQEKKQAAEKENNSEEAGYTPGENEFADGEGTLLNEETERLENEEED